MHAPLRFVGALVLIHLLAGCVPSKKYNAERTQRLQLERRSQSLERQLTEMRETRAAYRDSLLAAQSKLDTLTQEKDSIEVRAGEDLRLLAGELDRLQEKLQQKEIELQRKAQTLRERERNIRQLQQRLDAQQQANQRLKQRIKSALVGVDAKDLGVELRDGRVYVSLSEKLLFQQSSIDLEEAGTKALRQLAVVLNNNPDFDLQIEGHTDSVPFAEGSDYKDNWDLSVLRAASIARLLVQNKVDPTRIIAAGRSKYLPVADNDTEIGRKKNRRTEIVLIPKIEHLFEILEE